MIVDSSVAVKWLVQEPRSEAADSILRAGEPLHAPDLLVYEVGNALLKHPKTSPEDIETLAEIGIRFHPPEPDAIFRVARAQRVTFYDAAFLHLARKLGETLVTDDESLYQKAKGAFPVRLLKDL